MDGGGNDNEKDNNNFYNYNYHNIVFTGCDALDKSKEIQKQHIFFITDENTGVQYVVYREKEGFGAMGGITPRYNSDGTLHTVNDKAGENNE